MSNLITHIITDLSPGGAETFLLRLVSYLKDFRHHIISLAPLDDIYFANLFNSHVESVTSLNIAPKNILGAYKSLHLWKILKHQSPHLVQTWMYHANVIGGMAAYMQKIPVIWNIRNGPLNKENPENLKLNGFTNYFVRAGICLSSRIPKVIVSCSHEAARLHKKWGYKADKFIVIPNGIDPDVFFHQPQLKLSLRKELRLESTKIVIGFVGRFHPQKDIPNFLKAAKLFLAQEPSSYFILCGNELNYANQILNRWIENEGLNNHCHLLGKSRDTCKIYNALDICCLPSAYGEAFPNVIAEAMACGIPCVGTDIGDTQLIIGDKGLTVPSKNPQALAEAWRNLLSKQIEPNTIRQRILDNFTLSASSDAYRKLYLNLITKS